MLKTVSIVPIGIENTWQRPWTIAPTILVLAFMVIGINNKAIANGIPIAITPCANCYNVADLTGAAGQYFNTWWHKRAGSAF